MDNPQPDYFHLLKEAEQASDAADNFNVVFTSAMSRDNYSQLCNASEEAQRALISYVHKNYDALADSFDIPAEETPSDEETVEDTVEEED